MSLQCRRQTWYCLAGAEMQTAKIPVQSSVCPIDLIAHVRIFSIIGIWERYKLLGNGNANANANANANGYGLQD